MTKMANLCTTTEASSIDSLYVFGSVLNSDAPNDLDLIFVYDERVCSPQQAINVRRTLMERGLSLKLPPIHVVLLTRSESIQCRFIESEGALPLQKWIAVNGSVLHVSSSGVS
jgi:hypothetical protein